MWRFHGPRHLTAWLVGHPVGQHVLSRLLEPTDVACACVHADDEEREMERAAKLVVLNYQDRSEVYSKQRFRIHQIDIPGPTRGLTHEFELAQEEYATKSLPWGMRDVLESRNRRGVIRPCEMNVLEMLELEEYKHAFRRMVACPDLVLDADANEH